MNSLNNLHRQREFQREDLVKQLSKDRALKSSLSSDKHAESLRAQRQERESILQQKKQQELINVFLFNLACK